MTRKKKKYDRRNIRTEVQKLNTSSRKGKYYVISIPGERTGYYKLRKGFSKEAFEHYYIDNINGKLKGSLHDYKEKYKPKNSKTKKDRKTRPKKKPKSQMKTVKKKVETETKQKRARKPPFKVSENPAIKDVLMKMVGPHGLEIVEILLKYKKMDEFKLSSKIKLDVNFVRSLLYKLYSKKIVSYSKKRDQKKGWWIYSWEIHANRILELLIVEKQRELGRLREMKEKKSNEQTYVCDLCAVEMDFAEAMDSSFQCFSCGSPLKHYDNKQLVRELNERVDEVKAEIVQLEKIKEGKQNG